MAFFTKEFPGRVFESVEDYENALEEKIKLSQEMSEPSIEVSVERVEQINHISHRIS